VKTHTSIGARILSGSRFTILRLAEEIAYNHHERWDGDGYNGASGSDIPLAGRIVAVADVFDALTQKRPIKRRGRSTKRSPKSIASADVNSIRHWSMPSFA
jgi:response regulator RpfG family c-di-GMP phosphodiesterase